MGKVFRIVNEETRAKVEDPVARVLRDGLIVGLANHTLLISKDGSECPIADSGAPICDESGAITGVVLVFQDQTESRRRLDERETRLTLLQLLNEQNDTHEMIRNITAFLQKRSGCEAVGVRLKEGDDFPYFETRGFTQEFVQAESSLCGRDATGELLRDSTGNPVLECMCGNILSGRFNPALPFFTAKGSFWSNCTTELLASTTEEDRQARTRNRCNGEGYESVALFRLRSGDETLGLLQLNDRAKGRFTPELLDFMESTADEIAIALAQRQAQARLRESEERFSKSFKNNPAWLAIVHMGTNKVLEVNDAWTRIFGYTREEAIGRTTVELGIYDEETYRKIMEEAKAKGSVRNVEVSIKTRTGENRVLLVSREAIGIKGEPYLLAMGLDITDRKRAEQELLERTQLNQVLLDAFPCVALLLRPQTREIVASNAAAVRVGAIPGAHCFSTWGQRENPCPWCLAPEVWATGEARQLEIEALGTVWDAHWIPVGPDLYMHYAFDATEQKRVEQAIRESEERYRSLFDNMLEGYAYCKMVFEDGEPQDFIYLDVNQAFERLTGLKNVIGKKVTEVIPGIRESNLGIV